MLEEEPEERWAQIEEFESYSVSTYGRIYNHRLDSFMKTSVTNHGHAKISLRTESGARKTRSVSMLVGLAFVEAPNRDCDTVVLLDGDLNNVVATNIVWRPSWFAWKYVRQLKVPQPMMMHNLEVHNETLNIVYDSIIDAGMAEGLLFRDIWNSTYRAAPVYPTGSVFKVIKRV